MSRILYDLQRNDISHSQRYLDDKNARITVMGDASSGKTSFILRCVSDTFTEMHDPSSMMEDIYHTKINMDHLAQDINIHENVGDDDGTNQHHHHIINVHMLDTEEFEIADFSDIRNEQILQSDAFILCFDLTNIESFSNLRTYQRRIERVRGIDDPVPIIIAATKVDLLTERAVDYNDIVQSLKRFEIDYETDYFEISAKVNLNIKQILYTTLSNIKQYKAWQAERANLSLSNSSISSNSSSHHRINDHESINMEKLQQRNITKTITVHNTEKDNINTVKDNNTCCVVC